MNSNSTNYIVRPARTLVGSLRLPGDKSISHRYAMLAALAHGTSKFENFSTGADCASTLGCIQALGSTVRRNGSSVEVDGTGPRLRAPVHALDCGNSGSTMRMLSGIVAAQPFETELIGDTSLSRRPMRRIIDPLVQMGARIDSQDGRPPLRVHGAKLRGIEYKLPVASAQVKTCLLFAGLLADGETIVEEPLRTRDHGELALRAFGAAVEREGLRYRIRGGQQLHTIEAYVPGDISSAAFFLCAAALFPDSNLVIDNMLMNPTRAVLLDVLHAIGAQSKVIRLEEQHGELIGTVRLQPGPLRGATIFGALTAAVIDEIPVLAAIAPYTRDGIEIADAGELRVKESDRLAAIATNLRAMGAEVEETTDGLSIPGQQKLHGASLDSYGDHRIAMAFAIAALRAEGETEIRNVDCVAISYPEFFSELERLVER